MTTAATIPHAAIDGRPANEPNLFAVADLRKTYRLGRVSVPVLRGVNLNVREGEWLAILGASGSGKSTLLHLLGGLDRPDREGGHIHYRAKPLDSLSARDLDEYRAARVGFVFQFYHLLPEITVLENVAIAAMVRHGRADYRARRAEITDRAEALLDAFGLSHRLAHRPAELSGGERQRVAIARALINQPDALLADEPTGNLDRATGEKILDAVADHRRQSRQTIVMVTHDAAIAARADRVITLVDGQVAPAR